MLATYSLLIFSAAACCGIAAMALRDHGAALAARARLLERVSELFGAAVTEIVSDGFPRLVGRLADGRRVAVELVADTMVTRRLPQLWLIVTLTDISARLQGSIGALARPTGAEFYALTHELADRRDSPAGLDAAVLVRSTGRLSAAQVAAAENAFGRILSDPGVKEVVASPHGFRIVRQAAQGDRAAHMVFRQVRFPLEAVDPELVRRSLRDAETLAEALRQPPFHVPCSLPASAVPPPSRATGEGDHAKHSGGGRVIRRERHSPPPPPSAVPLPRNAGEEPPAPWRRLIALRARPSE